MFLKLIKFFNFFKLGLVRRNFILNPQKGTAVILIAFFILMITLMIAMTASAVMIYEIKMTREIANSVPAFFAADSGIEQCLYQSRNALASETCDTVGGTATLPLSNGATMIFSRTAVNKIEASGVYLKTNRKIYVEW